MKKIIKILLIITLLITTILLYARYIGTSGLITKEYKIEESDLPESFNGLKIIHFSDLHYLRITNTKTLKKIVKEINTINPDIVFFTGDLIDKDFTLTEDSKQELIDELKKIESKYGKYAIIGNHDIMQTEEELSDIFSNSNFTLLKNSYDIIYSKNNEKIFIGGVDTYSYDKANIDATMEYFTNNEDINYKIILSHEPDYTDIILNKYDIDLILSGHSHNDQINIPLIKTLFLPYGSQKYYKNHYKINNTNLYISSGIGQSRINMRLFNKPSINFYRINKVTDQ